jgi:hypothetical protein
MARIVALLAATFLACASAFAQANSPSGSAAASAAHADESLPHDRHGGMSVSADPYTDPARAKEKFGKANPLAVGILPVEVVMRNETNEPIRINLSTIQLEVRPRGSTLQGIDWLTVEEVASAIAHPQGTPAPKARRLPMGIPVPTKDTKAEKFADSLRPLALDTDIVPPMGMVHGFLFFDLGHDLSLLSNASLYVPDAVGMPSNKPLIFFEVPLGKP